MGRPSWRPCSFWAWLGSCVRHGAQHLVHALGRALHRGRRQASLPGWATRSSIASMGTRRFTDMTTEKKKPRVGPTTWEKGKSGNPGGRSPRVGPNGESIAELCRGMTLELVHRARDIALSTSTEPKGRAYRYLRPVRPRLEGASQGIGRHRRQRQGLRACPLSRSCAYRRQMPQIELTPLPIRSSSRPRISSPPWSRASVRARPTRPSSGR